MPEKTGIRVYLLSGLLVCLCLLYLLARRGPAIEIRGQLAAKDAAQIETAVRRQWRHEVLPDLTWKSLKTAPAAARDYLNSHVSLLVVCEDGSVAAGLTATSGSHSSEGCWIGYLLAKTNGAWRVTGGPFSDVPDIRVFYPPDWFE